MPEQLADLQNVRSGEQQHRYKKSLEEGECMFCLENLKKYHTGRVELELAHWYVIHSDYPYEHTQHHFLINARRHITKISEISPAAAAELIVIWNWLNDNYQIPGGALFFRFGDSSYNASSVAHLHAHIIVPDLTGPVKATIAKDYSWQAKLRRRLRKWWWDLIG